MQRTQSQRSLDDDTRPGFSAGRKLGEVEQALLWSLLQAEPECPSRVLLDQAAHRRSVMAVRLRHVNRWRAARGLNRRQGRPGQADGSQPGAPGAAVVRVTPRLSFVGVQGLAHGLDQHEACGPLAAQRTQAVEAHKQTHPEADFALVHHRESTRVQRLKALWYAPWLGLARLSACDTRAHGLKTLRGRGSQSATMRQCLGQLERRGVAEALLAVLVGHKTGPSLSVEGHLIASWSRLALHQGQITRLGRLMAGLQAVIAHDAAGPAGFGESSAPDRQVSQVILASCQKVAEATGSPVCVLDRAVNAVALARELDEQGLGVLCRLDDNEQTGGERCEATAVERVEEGTKVESGPWKERRQDDPRPVAIVQPAAGKRVVSWATPKVEETLEAHEWPEV